MTRWQNPARRDPRLFACLIALLVANILTLISNFAHIEWLMWVVAVGYVVAIASFVRGQVRSYRLTAQRFPVTPAPPAEPHEHVST
jgi:hypothetical protein